MGRASIGRSGRLARAGCSLGADRAQTASPNAGHPMAMAAGGSRGLDKPGHYALGPALPAPEPADITRAIALCRRAGLLSLAAAGAGVYVLGLDGALR